MDQARLIIDPPGDGAWNMAVDQALLETANKTGLVTFRFYRWVSPTLSLGYFQNSADRADHPPSVPCPFVRRRTGGGAIMHDQELTYSLCVPSANRWSSKNSDLYVTIHQIMIELLAQEGHQASLYRELGDPPPSKTADFPIATNIDPNAFMCFQRRSPGDVVLDGYKIVGSAQRRVQNALLQHGSILLEKSKFAPELPGIREVCGSPMDVEKTIKKLKSAVENRLQICLNVGKLSKIEDDFARQAQIAFFGNRQWNSRR